MKHRKEEIFRKIPSVNRLITLIPDEIKVEYKQGFLTEIARESLDFLRKKILAGEVEDFDDDFLKDLFLKFLEKRKIFNLRRVINATGVIIHTNLGRSPISEKVAEHIGNIVTGYSNLEIDLETGKRGLRYQNVEELLKRLTGAEAVCIVNNNAAAVLLVLSSLASGKEVIVSRGELIEIGGSFRIPDVMEQSGAVLREVGTTNKTKLKDYEAAITENTALLMKVHTSNYRILGFTESVSGKELVALGKKYGIPVYEDLGSGSFVDVRKFGLSYEPTVNDVLSGGVDVVSFSGDKLLGGPQAGIILGKKELIEKIRKHPLNRALRIDKMTLAALEATLKIYLEGKELEEIPVWKMVSQPVSEIERRAEKLVQKIGSVKGKAEVNIEEVVSEIGGGALPLETLPSFAVTIKPKNTTAEKVYRQLRRLPEPVIARIKDEKIVFDMRTVFDSEVEKLADSILEVLKKD
ncbi:L-seryl-tRNA(Sec) selenium transferase [Desulfurobacterium atlanticum]|uniref:L-seryl-tRNA(Sec) selenium transferase n=1 Tax=Desulfurobacterium atlanticum TaxID=240169 RepID=A0A238XXG0_9BACT|nr:L-seryl-tRNA(Sec) selenium transferase [Desulfurobacterium atlanticum]SNR63201.1 L-seryl-tRNA(Sec) selenium transferase [Desulfurobacterium atlanticum]